MTEIATVEEHSKTDTTAHGRLTALDGLRGVASVVVVLHHLYLLAMPVLTAQGGSGIGSAYWWMSETPLKLATAGTEAVLLFFVLSGVVVALPALKKDSFSWLGFMSGRLVRLYLPVWAALAIGAALIWLLPRDASTVMQGSWIDSSNAKSASASALISQATLSRVSYGVDNVLWSLRWELIFSALLPVFILLARALRRVWLPAVAVSLALAVAGALSGIDALRYLPVFFIGTLMASRLDLIRAWASRWRARKHERVRGWMFLALASSLLIAGWLTRAIAPAGTAASTALNELSVLGAVALVLGAIGIRGFEKVLNSRPCQWLGGVSFSLYLIHVPIIATLAFVLGDQNWWLIALVSVPLALVAAWLFNLAIESPAHRLARQMAKGTTKAAVWTKKRAINSVR